MGRALRTGFDRGLDRIGICIGVSDGHDRPQSTECRDLVRRRTLGSNRDHDGDIMLAEL